MNIDFIAKRLYRIGYILSNIYRNPDNYLHIIMSQQIYQIGYIL